MWLDMKECEIMCIISCVLKSWEIQALIVAFMIQGEGIPMIRAIGKTDTGLCLIWEDFEGTRLVKEDMLSKGMKQKILAAYQAIHQSSVLQNDVKLDNILKSNDGKVTIIDFGLAAVEGSLRDLRMEEKLVHDLTHSA